MYRVVVITDHQMADGFRLGGVDVTEANNVDDARDAVAGLLDDERSGIIALDARFEDAIDAGLERRIDAVYRPMVVILPLRDRLDRDAGATDRLTRLIRRAVGFDVSLKRGA